MKLSLTKKIAIGHVITLLLAYLLAEYYAKNFLIKQNCNAPIDAMEIGFILVFYELFLIVFIGFIHFLIKPIRKYLNKIWEGILIGFGLNSILMIPFCLIIQPQAIGLGIASKPPECFYKP